MRKRVRMRKSLYNLLYPSQKDIEEAEHDDEEEIYMKRIKMDGETQMVFMINVFCTSRHLYEINSFNI